METKTKSITAVERTAKKLHSAYELAGLSAEQRVVISLSVTLVFDKSVAPKRAKSVKAPIPVEEGTKGNPHIGMLPFDADVSITESDKEGFDFKLQSAQSNGVKHITKNVILESVAQILEGNFTSDKKSGTPFTYVPTETSKGKGVYCPAGYAYFARKELGLSSKIIDSLKANYV